MGPLNCCGLNKHDSPPNHPVVLRDITQDGRRMTMSTDYSAGHSFESEEPPRRIHDIFYSSDNSRVPITPHSNQFRLRSRESLQFIHHVTSKIKEKVSRDSSEGRSRKGRFERGRDRSDLTDSHSIVHDEDAVAIRTPRGTWPRQPRLEKSGSVQISPHELKRILNRSSTPSPQPPMNRPAATGFLAPHSPTKVKQRVFSKMLTDRASHLHEQTKSDNTGELVDFELAGRQRPRKYTFSDIDSPQRSEARTPSNKISISQQAADLKPRQLSSVSTGITAQGSTRSNTMASVSDDHSSEYPAGTGGQAQSKTSGPPISAYNPRHLTWIRGDPEGFVESHQTSVVPASNQVTEQGNPRIQSQASGGTEGWASEQIDRKESHGSKGTQSIHLYNLEISRRLASESQRQSMLQTASSPQLRTASSSNLSWGTGPDHLSLKAKRHASSSRFSSSKVPASWGSPKRNAASSSYSSQSRYESLPLTRNMTSRSVSFDDKLPHSPLILGQSTINSLGTSGRQSLENMTQSRLTDSSQAREVHDRIEIAKRRRGRDSDTFAMPLRSTTMTVADIEHLQGDTLARRADTAATTRYFSQADLEELSDEIAKRKPPSVRAISQYDGESERHASTAQQLLAPSVSRHASSALGTRSASTSMRTLSIAELSPSRKASTIAGIDPIDSSVWTSALREHARQDARILRRNAGSVSADHDVRWQTTKSRPSTASFLQKQSLEQNPMTDIQAHLDAYKLRSKSMATMNRPAQRPSSSGSTSSWARYPSHNRLQRIDSPATLADGVRSRDFVQPTSISSNIKNSRSLDLSRDHNSSPPQTVTKFKRRVRKAQSARFFKRSFRDLYQSKSLELTSKLAIDDAKGHRSSVSEGVSGKGTAFPELEMLSPQPLSPSYEGLAGDYFSSFFGGATDDEAQKEGVEMKAPDELVEKETVVDATPKKEVKAKGKKEKKEKKHKENKKKEKVKGKLSTDFTPTKPVDTKPSPIQQPPTEKSPPPLPPDPTPFRLILPPSKQQLASPLPPATGLSSPVSPPALSFNSAFASSGVERSFTLSPPPTSPRRNRPTLTLCPSTNTKNNSSVSVNANANPINYASCVDLPAHALKSETVSPVSVALASSPRSLGSPVLFPANGMGSPVSVISGSVVSGSGSERGGKSKKKNGDNDGGERRGSGFSFSYARAVGEHFSSGQWDVDMMGEQGGGWAGGDQRNTEGFAQALEERVKRERDVVLSLGTSRVRSPGSGGSVIGTGVVEKEVKGGGEADGDGNDHGHGNEGAGGVEGK